MSIGQAKIAEHVSKWFVSHQRDMPWRSNRTPWRSLVSEFMLQQTQVTRVIERFEPFMTRFPTPAALAQAEEETVLALWQGLGYYRRARMLQRAAIDIVERFAGEVPLEVPSLMSLPGVGRYTAGSIASIVGKARTPIVDGNVSRVLARLYEDDRPPDDPEVVSDAWARAEQLVDACLDPATLNEGLMEFGALVCTPATPQCNICPLQDQCAAKAAGRQREIPVAKRQTKKVTMHHHAIVIRRGGKTLMHRRAKGGLWAGLWQAPAIETGRRLTTTSLLEASELPLADVEYLTSTTRLLTHRRVHLHVHRGVLRPRVRCPQGADQRWMAALDLEAAPLSNAAREVLGLAAEMK